MNNISQPRPWVRFFARILDITFYSMILTVLFPTLADFPIQWKFQVPTEWQLLIHKLAAWGLISLFTYIIVETILLTVIGATLGKWLLRISLTNIQGQKLSFIQAFKRTFLVYFRGLALLLPFISLITLIYAYAALSSSGSTSWDKECHVTVTHDRIGFLRILVAIVLFILFANIKATALGTETMTLSTRVMYVCGIRG